MKSRNRNAKNHKSDSRDGFRDLFVTTVFQGPLGLSQSLRKTLKTTALKLPEVDLAGQRWSKKNYRNGYTSYGSCSELHLQFSAFEKLKIKLDRVAKTYAKKVGLAQSSRKIELSALWVNLMGPDCYHAFHAHPLSVLSGTYYLEVPEAGSPLRIEDPRAPLFMACPHRPIQVDLSPKNDEVIFFESWLKHEVPPSVAKETRISISFNYDLV